MDSSSIEGESYSESDCSDDDDADQLPLETTIQLRQQLNLLCKADKKKYNFVRYISIRNLKNYNLKTQYASKYGAAISRTQPGFYQQYMKHIWKNNVFLYYMYAYYLSLHEAGGSDIWCDEGRNTQIEEIEGKGFIDLT
jgi:hypothetical protein